MIHSNPVDGCEKFLDKVVEKKRRGDGKCMADSDFSKSNMKYLNHALCFFFHSFQQSTLNSVESALYK